MRTVAFVAPFPLETTMRFARAAAAIDGVRFVGIFQEAPQGGDARLFTEVVTVADGLDPRQVITAAEHLQARHGKLHRVIGILEPLQGPIAEVRRALGIPGTDPETARRATERALVV